MLNIDPNLTLLSIELLEPVFDQLGDVVFCVKDRDGCYRSVNQAFVERLGVNDKQDLIGRVAGDFFEPQLASIYENQDRQVFEAGRTIVDQLERIAHVDGSMNWFLASKFPINDAHGAVVGLVGVSQDLNWPSDSNLELANLRRLVEYIKENLDQPLRTDQLARQIELSAIQLDRRMKRVFRLSTKKFIMKCRLEKAMRQLEATDLPLSAIALACGFTDQSSFTRHFRNATSNTPGNYRKSIRNKK